MTKLLIEPNFQPDPASSESLKNQLLTYFTTQIQSGSWPLNGQLRSLPQLRAQLNVEPDVITAVLSDLIIYGMLRQTESGYIITQNSWSAQLLHTPVNWRGFDTSAKRLLPPPLKHKPTIQLSLGQLGPGIFSPELLEEAVAGSAEYVAKIGEAPIKGFLQLRERLAEELTKWDMDVDAHNILITSGSLQGLQLIAQGFLDSHSTVYTAPASYLRSLRVLQAVKANFAEVPVDDDGLKFWTMPHDPGHNILYTVPTFANPMGQTMSQKRREALIQFAQDSQLPIVEDSAYQDLWLDEQPPKPLQALDTAGNVIYLGTISKVLTPGMRVGWMVGSRAIINRLTQIKSQIDYGTAPLAQLALADILGSQPYEDYLLNMRQELRNRRDEALNTLETELADVATWNHPAGGFYIWVTLKDGISAQKVSELAAKDNVAVNPGTLYGRNAKENLRLSFAYETPKRFAIGIERLAQIIADHF